MRFVKASERLPANKVDVVIKEYSGILDIGWYSEDDDRFHTESDLGPLSIHQVYWLDESPPADDMTTAFQNEPVAFLLSNALRHLTQDQQRQLCNALLERLPVPASIEDEAERMYPEPPGRSREQLYYDHHIVDIQRSAHITCARQYMDTIEKLRAKIVSLEEELALYRLEK